MRKYLAIFGVIFLGLAVLGLAVYVHYQDDRYTQEAAQKAAALHKDAASTNAGEKSFPENVPGTERQAPSWYGWYGFFRWPNGTTTWAIILTLIAIAEQTRQTRKAAEAALISSNASNTQIQVMQTQAGHMERQSKILEDSVAAAQKAADAAERSAVAAMGVAVPTLMLHWFEFKPKTQMEAFHFFRHPEAIIQVMNYGQSPAFLKSYWVEFSWDELPDEPVYNFPYPCDVEEVVAPGGIFTLDPSTTSVSSDIAANIATELADGDRYLKVYGFVAYGDIFGSPIRYLKFSKILREYSDNPFRISVMDYGGHKYTGHHENYDAPNQKWPKPI